MGVKMRRGGLRGYLAAPAMNRAGLLVLFGLIGAFAPIDWTWENIGTAILILVAAAISDEVAEWAGWEPFDEQKARARFRRWPDDG